MGNQEKEESSEPVASTEEQVPSKPSGDMEATEWFESGAAQNAMGLHVKTVESYFCRLCGEVIEKDAIGKHLTGHSAELYQTMPEDNAKLTLTRSYAYHSIKPNGTCQHCNVDISVLDKIKRALRSLSEGYSFDIVV